MSAEFVVNKVLTWSSNEDTFELPSGNYWIGDLCYVLNQELYDDIVLGGGDGVFKVSMDNAVPEFIAFAGTYAGDGNYLVKLNNKKGGVVSVDAGIIGIVHTSLMEYQEKHLGFYYSSQNSIKVQMYDGIFKFTSKNDKITINTRDC